MDEARLVRGDRGGNILIFRSFRFHKHQNRGDNTHWRCSNKNCTAKLTTNIVDLADGVENNIRVLRAEEHCHPPETERIERGIMRQRLVDEVMQDPSRPSIRVYSAEVVRVRRQGGGDRLSLPSFQGVRSTMQRARSATLPAIPANLDDVHVQGIWSETWAQERFLLHVDNDWGILVFATDENLQRLRQCRTVYMDGTFKSCPRPYNQVFTILGNLNGFVIPFVHVLMAERTIGHYRQALQAVKTGVRRSTHHNWRPRLIVSDFELALRTAIETELPATRIGGCYFHFNQALWRKIQELGLSAPYQQNQRLKEVIRKVMAIGYLPLAVVHMNFTALVGARRTQRLTARYPQLADFLTYVSNTYVRHRATFPPPVWNVYDRGMDQRTNNHVEGECYS